MTRLFGQKSSTYMYGKILNNKFITPTHAYPIESLEMSTGMHPVKVAKKIEVFYLSSIFNSYLVSNEEDVNTLFSVDGKTTITRDKIAKDTLYTFKIIKETDKLRIVELYNFDSFYPGFKTKGQVKWMEDKKGKRAPMVETKYGTGHVFLQNNNGCVDIDVVLHKKDKKLYFVQVGASISGIIKLSVSNVISNNKYGVKYRNIRGILLSSKTYKVHETVLCVVKEECFGHYLFIEHVELKIGTIVEAQVKSYSKNGITLKYGGYDGYMPTAESRMRRYGKNVRGVVYDFDGELFLLSTKRFAEQDDSLKRNVDLSVPFDSSSDGVCGSDIVEDVLDENKSLAAERKRSRVMNEIDFLMDIKAHPGEAMPVIKYIQHKMEIEEMEAPKQIFWEYLPRIEGDEKDKLCISFVNYLLFINNAECLKIVKRLAKICSPRFLEAVATNTKDLRILRLYFEMVRTKKSFRMYLDGLFKENAVEANRLIEKNKEFLCVSVDLIYKHCENPRIVVEKLLVDKKEVWLSYINNENGMYLRSLYRRVVDKKWRMGDIKEFYRMWLEFEKDTGGNVEEVKARAREYVESVKNSRNHE